MQRGPHHRYQSLRVDRDHARVVVCQRLVAGEQVDGRDQTESGIGQLAERASLRS